MSLVQSLQLGILAAIGIACLALWNLIFLRRSAGQEIVPYEPRRLVPWSGLDVGITFLVLLALVTIFSTPVFLYMRALQHHESDEPPVELTVQQKGEIEFRFVVVTGAAMTVGTGIFVAWRRRRGADRSDLGFDQSHLGADIGRGVAGFAVASVPIFILQMILIQWIPAEHAVSNIIGAGLGPLRESITAFVVVIVAPITEEFFFRVVLQGWLEKLYVERAARYAVPEYSSYPSILADRPPAGENLVSPALNESVQEQEAADNALLEPDSARAPDQSSPRPGSLPVWISSLLFALVHLNAGPSAVPLFFFALVLGYLYRQTHRLWPSVVTHMSLNAFSTFLLATGAG